jgi:hypothetical protein
MLLYPNDAAQQRALAGAGWTHEAAYLALARAETDAAQDLVTMRLPHINWFRAVYHGQ